MNPLGPPHPCPPSGPPITMLQCRLLTLLSRVKWGPRAQEFCSIIFLRWRVENPHTHSRDVARMFSELSTEMSAVSLPLWASKIWDVWFCAFGWRKGFKNLMFWSFSFFGELFFVGFVYFNKLIFLSFFLAVTWQLYRFPCHSLTDWVTVTFEKHYQRALWETCDPWDMWPEW